MTPRHMERHVLIGPDTRLVAKLTPNPERGVPDADIRLARRSPSDSSDGAFIGTGAGFKLPASKLGHLIRELSFLQAQAAEMVTQPASELDHDG